MLGSAADEMAKVEVAKARTTQLRERFEDDYAFVRNERYTIPKKEGDWESFTTNRPSTDAGKTINTLSSARLLMKILLADENEKQRKNLSKTEQFPYGVIALRDSLFTGIPEALSIQPSLAWHAVVRGWVGLLVYLFEEDDGKNGKVVPHIPVLDILNTYWVTGSNGLLWLCSKRFASQDDVKDQYNEEVAVDSQGRVELYTVWDRDEFGTIASTEREFLRKEKHGLKHIPALILPVGSHPFIQSGKFEDTMKDVGMSFASNNRNLYDTESRIGSYLQTMVGEAARAPLGLEYDSTMGGAPIDLEGSRQKGSTVPIDVGKGQRISTIVTQEMTRTGFAFFDYVQGLLSKGGHTPVAFGQINQALPAAGINLLTRASLDNIKPPQRAMEDAFAWLAQECVSQYKSGDFPKMEIQGMDGSSRRFKVDVKPKDIDDGWNFEAKLLPEMPQDDVANVGMAVQTTQAGILSKETARDKWNLVDDTDLEQRKLDREKAYEVAAITMRRVAAALQEDGDTEGAQFILDAIETQGGRAEKGVASQPGSVQPQRPSSITAAAQANMGNDTGERAGRLQNFLRRAGLGGGR